MTRHIDFEGIENFRDYGGYGTACGRGVVQGRLFRSANHHRATDADVARMRELGVALVVDLRRKEERLREPSRRWDGFAGTVIENDIPSDSPDWLTVMQAAELTPEFFFDDGIAYYRRAPHEPRHLDLFRRYFHAIAETEGAVVVHCAAGKDRTGLICALTHHLAGVHPDDIMADYLLTNDEARITRKVEHLRTWFAENLQRDAPEEALRVAASVHPEYLQTAIQVINEQHGSLDGYIEEALGIGPELRARIHDRVLNG
jgi:protein-tyrosine phosphatase